MFESTFDKDHIIWQILHHKVIWFVREKQEINIGILEIVYAAMSGDIDFFDNKSSDIHRQRSDLFSIVNQKHNNKSSHKTLTCLRKDNDPQHN